MSKINFKRLALMFGFGKEQKKNTKDKSRKNLIESFNESAYLEVNPDIKLAIEAGQFRDASHHLEIFGLNEIEQGLRKFHKDFDFFDKLIYGDIFPNLDDLLKNQKYDSVFDYFCQLGYKQIINKNNEDKATEYKNKESEFTIISESGLLNIEWMKEVYSDMVNLDPLHHYCMYGHKENRNPNPFFDTKWYKETYPEVGKKNPLLHYTQIGWKKGYNPSPHFDVKKYIESYLKTEKKHIEPLHYFFTEGKEKGNQAIRYDYGREDCSEIINSSLFMEEWYIKEYPDMENIDPLIHFCMYGYKENRNPNPFFNTKWYKEMYLIDSEENPLLHYIKKGWKKGYNPSGKFNTQQYIHAYLDINRNDIEPLGHFLRLGRNQGFEIVEAETLNKLTIDKNYSIANKFFPELKKLFNYQVRELAPEKSSFYENNLKIHFVIPDYGKGGGGHMTIFRMVRHLEWFGHEVTIWIFNPSIHHNENDAYDDIIKYYNIIKADVKFIDDTFADIAEGDAIFATGWDTVWPVMSVNKFKSRFYLVQDYEPLFFPQGTHSELAKYTYSQDLNMICASPWLEDIMKVKYKKWATSFDLAADRHIFFPAKKKTSNNIPRIAFYARHFTPRRGVELGMIALELLAEEGMIFHVDFYGTDLDITKAPFSATNHGVKSPEYLADLYRKSDIGVVFSLTNYSLVPQEMMQCNLPIVEYDTESTRAIYPDNTVQFAGPDPIDIKNKIKNLLKDKNLQKKQISSAKKWVGQFSWEKSAKNVEKALITRLFELGYNKEVFSDNDSTKVSVVVPTYNGGELFKKVLKKIQEQKTPWKFEIIIIDSESNDGTFEYASSFNDIKVIQIKKDDFNHGATRNYGVELSKGEYIAYITQDAIPYNEDWLYSLVLPLEHYKDAGGTFGKHIAHDDAKFFTKLDISNHFDKFDNIPLCVSKNTDLDKYKNDVSWRQTLHFYSDNNSCLRRSVWEKIPYRKVKYGEDNLWANDIIEAGYSKVYSIASIVKHSHDYDINETFIRSKIDGDYFQYFWGYQMIEEDKIDSILKDFEAHDSIVVLENGLSDDILEERLEILETRFRGHAEGQKKSPSLFDENNDEKSKY